jgi:iron(III) transport system substrate-binding protein
MFKQFGREFCEKIAAQVPEFSQTPQEAERRVARGEFPLYVPLQMPNILKLKGLPVRGLIMDEGAPYTVYGNCVLDLAENQNAARLFLEYCLSQDVQMMFARDGYGISISDFSSAVPEDMRWLSNAKLMGTIDPWQEREMRAEAVKIFGR